jgi:hypothetical protein
MQKMTKLITIILTIISITVVAQSTDCGCFNGIGSTESDKPSLTIKFSNGTTLSVCGYEQERLSENEVLISEFNVFNCKTGEQLVEYGAVQNCIVKKDKHGLTITELKYLPADENWKWEQVKIGLQQIFVKENELVVLEQKSAFEQVVIEESKADFLIELRSLKGTGKLDNPEEILGRLEILALNDFKGAVDILFDFENYFNYKTDGAIAEQWKDAVATVKWIKD